MTISEACQIVTTIVAAGAWFSSNRNHKRLLDQSRRLNDTDAKIEVVHSAANSMKDELVALTAKSSRAEGNKEGREEQKEERRVEDAGVVK